MTNSPETRAPSVASKRAAVAAGQAGGLSRATRRSIRLPRLVAELYGSTTLGDCLVALRHLIALRDLVRGPVIKEYENAFARRIGVHYAYSFSTGRLSLYALLRAFGIGPGDEVLLQLPTHIVVANAIRYVGARPVYVDCTHENFNIDLEEAERKTTPRTKALVLQHTFGIPADMDAALDLARRNDLILIEDCVHALGSTYRGRQVGGLGDAAFFSTEETKTISSTMGGMAVTDDSEAAARLAAFQATCAWPAAATTARYLLKLVVYHVVTHPHVHHYTRPIYTFLGKSPRTRLAPAATSEEEQRGDRPPGYEQRLSNAQAALALRQLRRLDANLAHRRAVAETYRTLLGDRGFPVPEPPPLADAAYLRYPLLVADRQGTRRHAARFAVLGGWFSSVLGEVRALADGGYEPGSCPRAEEATRHLVNLPTHPRVNRRDVENIVEAVATAAARGGSL